MQQNYEVYNTSCRHAAHALRTLHTNTKFYKSIKTTAVSAGTASDELCCLQILPDDGFKDYLEDHLDVAGVSGCCEVGVDDLVFVVVA